MNKIYGILGVFLVLSMGFAFAGNGKAQHLYLYEKDPVSWEIVDGAWGKMMYKADSFVFNGHGLEAGEYTLLNYCGWGENQNILGVAESNDGNVHIKGTLSELCIEGDNEGAKIWLVKSSDLTGEVFNAWTPTEYLFEHNLI